MSLLGKVATLMAVIGVCSSCNPPPNLPAGEGCVGTENCLPTTLYFSGASFNEVDEPIKAPRAIAAGGSQIVSVWFNKEASMPFDFPLDQSKPAFCTQGGATSAFCARGAGNDQLQFITTPPKVEVRSKYADRDGSDSLLIGAPYTTPSPNTPPTYDQITLEVKIAHEVRAMPPTEDFVYVHGDWTHLPRIAFARGSAPPVVTFGLLNHTAGVTTRLVDESIVYQVGANTIDPQQWDAPTLPVEIFRQDGPKEISLLRNGTEFKKYNLIVTSRIDKIEYASEANGGIGPVLEYVQNRFHLLCFSTFANVDRQEYLIHGARLYFTSFDNIVMELSPSPVPEVRNSCISFKAPQAGLASFEVVGNAGGSDFRHRVILEIKASS